MSQNYTTQNELLLNKLKCYYSDDKIDYILPIINGTSRLSIRLIDWFVTNYAKKYFVVYKHKNTRFKVYTDYKLKLKSYSKKRFDPFCRWERINIPYKDNTYIQTTLGQLNFFKWAIDNHIIEYIENHYQDIERDMNERNSSSKNHKQTHTRKQREELSISAIKSIKKEEVEITVTFS